MYIMINKSTGKVVAFNEYCYSLDDFTFSGLDDCLDYMYADENLHAEDMLVFKVDEALKPVISFETTEDHID